ncbi:hypothetical protein FPHYL_1868 [Fusarium phyllophilum]|uniref:2EXR domain-containing protein n=1 Tax=Fusarium phyllophilum TaxID=47803 RepID=A0A8H5KAA1_9HYPO|nr:hypothetical protein FPHYL_1868 [Fusarium phyllophilum]
MDQSFPQFPKLPPEVRATIWEHTLPEGDGGAALYMYNMDWWAQYSPPGVAFHDMMTQSIQQLSRPPHVQVPIPTCAAVCQEGRRVVERWRKKNSLEWYFREETKGDILVRRFDAERDILYVSRHKWESFQLLAVDWENDVEHAAVIRIMESIKYLALPAFTAYYSIVNIAGLLPLMKNIKAIYVLWNELPKAHMIKRQLPDVAHIAEVKILLDAPVQPRWELDKFLQREDEVEFHYTDEETGREYVEDGELSEWLEDIDDLWSTTEVDPEIWDEDEEKLKTSQIHVTAKKLPTWL